MADLKISELNELFNPTSGDTLPIVNAMETKKITVHSLLSGSNIQPYFVSTDTGSAQNYKVGDNVWLGDVGEANTLVVNGIQNSGSAFVMFGYGTGHIHPYIGHVANEDANVLSVVADTTKISSAVIIGSGSLVAGDPEMLHIYSSGSFNIAYLKGNTDNYTQINVQNTNSGSTASSDIVVTADNGTEEMHYVNMGINSSNYVNEFEVGYQNDGYVINSGNDLYLGTLNASANHSHVHLFTSGAWENPQISLLSQSRIGFNTPYVTSSFKFGFSGSAQFQDRMIIGSGSLHSDNPETLHVFNSGSFNIAHFEGLSNTYAQINVKNPSNNSGASSDIVATADNGTEEIHYVNMGINSSGFMNEFSVGYQNDAYVYNAGRDLYIGTMEAPDINHGHVHLFTSSSWDSPQISILNNQQVGFNTSGVTEGFIYEFSGSVKLNSDLKVDGHIQSSGSLILQPDTSDSRYVEIYNTDTTDIHIKGNAAYTFLGDDTNYVKIDSSAETITINATSGTTINNVLKLNSISQLPASASLGDLVVSGSNLYFHNGIEWNIINITSLSLT